MGFFEVFAFLHFEERSTRGVANNCDPIPHWGTERLICDVTHVRDFCPHSGKRADWCVGVVGGFARDAFSSVVIVCNLDVLHEIECPKTPVVFRLHMKPCANEFDVDGSIRVFKLLGHNWSSLDGMSV